MSFFRKATAGTNRPDDSPDLSWMMGFVTTVGGISAYTTKRSMAGLIAGCGLGAVFGVSGAMIASQKPENHEIAHQIALLGSVMFGGAMGYRAGANPYVGPGGAMLAALGGLSSAYHLAKWVEWRSFESARVQEAERLLREHYRHLGQSPQQAAVAAATDLGHAPALGAGSRGPGAEGPPGAGAAFGIPEHVLQPPPPPQRRVLPGGYPGGGGPTVPPGGR